jgi:hypothetical protein
VLDRLTGKTVVRRIEAAGERGSRASEILAIRAAELLRASLMELLVRPTPGEAARPPVPPPKVVDWAAERIEPASAPSRWGYEAGLLALGSFEGVHPTFVPLIRARFRLDERWSLRATAAGLGTRSTIDRSYASASVSQDVLLLDLCYEPRPEAIVRPRAALGAGAYRFAVAGSADWPYRGIESSRWSPALDAALGATVRMTSYLGVGLEGHALFSYPYPSVRFFDETVARAGRPTWAAALTLGGWL